MAGTKARVAGAIMMAVGIVGSAAAEPAPSWPARDHEPPSFERQRRRLVPTTKDALPSQAGANKLAEAITGSTCRLNEFSRLTRRVGEDGAEAAA